MEKVFGWEFKKDGWSTEVPFEASPQQITMSMMTGHGDIRKVWNAANRDEVDDAKRSFEHLVKEKRYLAFRVAENGEKSEQIREFDGQAGKMILVPPVAGGR